MVGQSEEWFQINGTVEGAIVQPYHMRAHDIVHRPHIELGII